MAASPMAARTSSFAGPAVLPQQFNAGQNVVPPMGGSTSSFSGLGSPQGNRQIPQEMIDANARASALTALDNPQVIVFIKRGLPKKFLIFLFLIPLEFPLAKIKAYILMTNTKKLNIFFLKEL
jgi:hypothetical protein